MQEYNKTMQEASELESTFKSSFKKSVDTDDEKR